MCLNRLDQFEIDELTRKYKNVLFELNLCKGLLNVLCSDISKEEYQTTKQFALDTILKDYKSPPKY